jgi:hypothetical protein
MTNIDPKSLRIVHNFSTSEHFSFFEYLAAKRDGPEIAFTYAKVFWPDLIEVQGFVLLAENYDPAYFERVYKEYGALCVEAMINTIYLDDLFGVQETDDSVWEALGAVLCAMWKARAKHCFPEKDFRTEFRWYSEEDAPGVTLQQAKWVEK